MKPLFRNHPFKKASLTLISFLVTFLATTLSWAQGYYRIGQPSIGGNGCPAQSASASISPDGSAISILFDRFLIDLQPGFYNSVATSRQCHFTIPVEVQPGYNLEATYIDYRGFAQIPGGIPAHILTTGPILKFSRFMQPNVISRDLTSLQGSFYVREEIQQGFKGRCQGQRVLNFTTQLRIGGGRKFINLPAQTLLVMDSTDVGGPGDTGIELGMRVVPCQ
jgi:hypothetical protein